jgi:hypothetical protein
MKILENQNKKTNSSQLGAVFHTHNLNYSRGLKLQDQGLRPAWVEKK